ncbi:amidase [Chachezhania sediminis]|uniref:amidase n=1 Tax=Chachezhania sediminis TaxID=2599291 RepID=UPI00131D1F7C|nr:amidase family protein [Chachezhania sediminis]
MTSWCDSSAGGQTAAVRSGQVTATALVEAHLDRISARNPSLNAICTLAADQAIARAGAIDSAHAAGLPLGPLAGVVTRIKDVTPVRNMRTTYGSPLFADHVPSESALVVRRLEAAGAIVIGKTNSPEFAAGANTVNKVFGATHNPYQHGLSAGGSTGGGAVGAATGMIALAEGTDFGGSLRVPAAFCGVYGLRPTVGLIPSHPVPDPWDTGRVHGPIARTPGDIALALDAMRGPASESAIAVPDHADHHADPGTPPAEALRIGFAADITGIGIDPGPARAFALAMERISALVRTEDSGFFVPETRDAYRVARALWMAVQYRDLFDRGHTLAPALSRNIAAGRSLTGDQIAKAHATRAALWHRWQDLFARFDVLITPTVPVDPFPITQGWPCTVAGTELDDDVDWIAPTYAVTLMGLPALQVPFGKTPAGFPFGLQLIGPRFLANA